MLYILLGLIRVQGASVAFGWLFVCLFVCLFCFVLFVCLFVCSCVRLFVHLLACSFLRFLVCSFVCLLGLRGIEVGFRDLGCRASAPVKRFSRLA